MAGNGAALKDLRNPWRTTTFLFAGFLLLSLTWNGLLSLMILQNPDRSEETEGIAAHGSQAPSSRSSRRAIPISEVRGDGDPVIGDRDAPVVVVEFSDFECPFSARFFADSFKRIKTNFINTGKVRFIFRDYPMNSHTRAVPAAVAAECVGNLLDDEASFEFHGFLFSSGGLEDGALIKGAAELGIPEIQFAECYADADGSLAAEIRADGAGARAIGVRGTPTFFINGRKLIGAQPYEVFKAAIEAELR
jgi:protein-disulfide isomerase